MRLPAAIAAVVGGQTGEANTVGKSAVSVRMDPEYGAEAAPVSENARSEVAKRLPERRHTLLPGGAGENVCSFTNSCPREGAER